MTTRTITRTVTAAALLLVIGAGTAGYPRPAHAFLGVGDTTIVLTNIDDSITQKTLNPLAYTVAKVALHSLSKSVVNWINSGFNGSPAFIQDLNQTLLNIGDAEVQRFVNEFASNGSLQNVPWKDDIAQSVLANYFRNTSNDSFSLNNPYTLDQVSSDPQAFVNGDYSKGGLNAWMSLVLSPGNNPLALFQSATNEINNRVAGAQGKKITELNWSNGFSSYRGDCPQLSNQVLSFTGATAGSVSLNNANQDCVNQPILTPGAVIAQAANKHLVDAGVDEYISADSIGEIVNALIGNLVGNVLGGGGLAGTSRPSAGGGRSYIDQAADPATQTAASNSLALSTTFLGTLTEQIDLLTQYKNAWMNMASAATAAKTALSGSCSLVDTAIADAGSSVARADSALGAYEAIRSSLTAQISADATTQQTIVADATAQFATVQSSGTLPTAAEIQYAISEGTARAADTSTGTQASLYSRLLDIASTKTCTQ